MLLALNTKKLSCFIISNSLKAITLVVAKTMNKQELLSIRLTVQVQLPTS